MVPIAAQQVFSSCDAKNSQLKITDHRNRTEEKAVRIYEVKMRI